MFLLFEDEWGTINLIVPRNVYERRRALARAESLLLARGRLERSPEGVQNVIVHELEALERYVLAEEPGTGASVHRLARGGEGEGAAREVAEGEGADGEDGAAVGAGMRAVAPPVQSFGVGRRR